MRFWVGVLVTLLLAAVVAGCAPKGQQEGHTVWFDGPVHLFDEGVYATGNQVGTVISTETWATGVSKATIALEPQFVAQTGNALALFVHAGRLEATKLHHLGQPLDRETPICGFTSKADLNWFKIKTLFNDRIHAAQRLAVARQASIE